MAVTLTHSSSRDVAVISVDSERAIAFLCRSLMSGPSFADYPALLIDLRGAGRLSPATRQVIEEATRSCLARRQWLGVVQPGETVTHAIARARRWQHLVQDRAGAATTSLRVAGGMLAGLMQGAGGLVRDAALVRPGAVR